MPYDDINDGALEAREAYLVRLAADINGEPTSWPDEDYEGSIREFWSQAA